MAGRAPTGLFGVLDKFPINIFPVNTTMRLTESSRYHRRKNRQTDRQSDRQTDRQSDRQTDILRTGCQPGCKKEFGWRSEPTSEKLKNSDIEAIGALFAFTGVNNKNDRNKEERKNERK